MKKAPLLISMAALVFALAFTGCNGGGTGAAVGVAQPETSGTVPVPGTGDGSDGAGTPGAGQTSVTLSWDAPATNTNGTALTDLAGYTVHYGTSSGNYTGKVSVGLLTTCSLTGLAPGTYYFAVTASNTSGSESGYSNEVSKTAAL